MTDEPTQGAAHGPLDEPPDPAGREMALQITGLVSRTNHRGMVQIEGAAERMQMTAEQARHVGLALIDASAVALADAHLVGFATETLQLKEGQVADVLSLFRQYRHQRTLPTPGADAFLTPAGETAPS